MKKSVHMTLHQKADLAVLITLLGLVLMYLRDAYLAAAEVLNLILILPVTGLVLIMCLIEFINQFGNKDKEVPTMEPVSSVVPVISLFAIYVSTLPWLGFDVGTFLFVATFLWLHGEKRWPWVLGYSLVFTTLIALFFSAMLPYPMPMLLMATEY